MQRLSSSVLALARTIGRQLLGPAAAPEIRRPPPPCDVFINHRGPDTKRNVSGLLDQHLRLRGLHQLRPFLDCKSMKPGDKLYDKIELAIQECKVGVAVIRGGPRIRMGAEAHTRLCVGPPLAVISPTYCGSYFCLHELSRMTELKKRVVPIFWDVKPSDLRVRVNDLTAPEDIRKFRLALEEVKLTVGLTFDTRTGDWVEFLENATNVVIQNLNEVEQEKANTGLSNR